MTCEELGPLSFGAASASLGVDGRFDPAEDAVVSGSVTVRYSVLLKGTPVVVEGRLREVEASVCDEVSARLANYDAVVAERDALLEEKRMRIAKRGSVAGYSTAEIMLTGDFSPP
jgi:hypothetical protein